MASDKAEDDNKSTDDIRAGNQSGAKPESTSTAHLLDFGTPKIMASQSVVDASLDAHVKASADKSKGEWSTETLAAGGILAAGVGLAIVTRGRSLLRTEGAMESAASRYLPEVMLGGARSAEVSALRSQTVAEKVTEKTFRFGANTANKILEIMGKAEKAEPSVFVSDDVRRSVFNRFLSRLDQDRYVLHGSYQLESQQFIARKATKDVDLLALDPTLVKGTKAETNAAILEDFQRMLSRDKKDGLTFDVAFIDKEPIHGLFPRMRHGVAIARSEGQELMRIPLDLRYGAKTLLPPQQQVLRSAAYPGGPVQEVTVSSMQPAETVAYKLFSYTNRTIGGTDRKVKDLTDMAQMIKKGVDENQVVQALEAWTSRGYTLGAMRHPELMTGAARLEAKPSLMMGHSREELDASFDLVRNYYARVAPRVADTPLRPEVSQSILSRVGRFFEKQKVVYPKE